MLSRVSMKFRFRRVLGTCKNFTYSAFLLKMKRMRIFSPFRFLVFTVHVSIVELWALEIGNALLPFLFPSGTTRCPNIFSAEVENEEKSFFAASGTCAIDFYSLILTDEKSRHSKHFSTFPYYE